jgi:bifunctional DNA-binding transcriptional regulator/antitoxin component of YhaV-PrlF toxin-antitoxin module
MAKLTLTSKRQATLPKELCDELRVGPGDRIEVQRSIIDSKPVWTLRPVREDWSWLGAIEVPKRTSHDMESIRASIARGRGKRPKR